MIGAAMGYMLRDYAASEMKGKDRDDPIVLLPKGMERRARRMIRNMKHTLDEWS